MMKTVKQTLNRQTCQEVYQLLKRNGLRPQERYDPSLSGNTMGIFRVQVLETEYEQAKTLLDAANLGSPFMALSILLIPWGL